MIARLLISNSIKIRVGEIEKLLSEAKLKKNHPDVLYFEEGDKLGIEQARIIKQHFSLKPYSAKGRVVIIEDASVLTIEAQNALLKTLEEPPIEAILILGTKSDANLLPTILSRCQITRLDTTGDDTLVYHNKYASDLEKLLNSSIEERFSYIEKLKEKEEFLHALVYYFHHHLMENTQDKKTQEFVKEILQAEEWAKQNVNIRAILEYLMLKLPEI